MFQRSFVKQYGGKSDPVIGVFSKATVRKCPWLLLFKESAASAGLFPVSIPFPILLLNFCNSVTYN